MTKSKTTDFFDALSKEVTAQKQAKLGEVQKLGYIRVPGVIDTSYSMLQVLYSCPRKFYLNNLRPRVAQEPRIHLAYGHAVEAGITTLFITGSIERACVATLAAWDYPALHDTENTRNKNKSFDSAITMVHTFYETQWPTLNAEWEMLMLDGKPAAQLLFYLRVKDISYQGHIDLILQHRETKAIAVWELKTTGYAPVEAKWGNSEQTLGYYLVAFWLAQELNLPLHGQVMYLECLTGKQDCPEENWGFFYFPFTKSDADVLDFINTLLANFNVIQFYQENEFWPKRGSSCYNFMFRQTCEYYGICGLETIADKHDISVAEQYIESRFEALPLTAADIIVDVDKVLSFLLDKNADV